MVNGHTSRYDCLAMPTAALVAKAYIRLIDRHGGHFPVPYVQVMEATT